MIAMNKLGIKGRTIIVLLSINQNQSFRAFFLLLLNSDSLISQTNIFFYGWNLME